MHETVPSIGAHLALNLWFNLFSINPTPISPILPSLTHENPHSNQDLTRLRKIETPTSPLRVRPSDCALQLGSGQDGGWAWLYPTTRKNSKQGRQVYVIHPEVWPGVRVGVPGGGGGGMGRMGKRALASKR